MKTLARFMIWSGTLAASWGWRLYRAFSSEIELARYVESYMRGLGYALPPEPPRPAARVIHLVPQSGQDSGLVN